MEDEYEYGSGGVGQLPYMAPMNNQNGNMVMMTNPREELRELEANLRGGIIDDAGDFQQKFPARMNEFGINQVMSMVRTMVNRVAFMSNINEKAVRNFMDYLADTLAQMLMVNKQTYGIRSDADRTSIYFNCVTLAHIGILRGLQEGDRRFWKGTTHEILYGNMPDKGGGMLGRMTPTSWWK